MTFRFSRLTLLFSFLFAVLPTVWIAAAELTNASELLLFEQIPEVVGVSKVKESINEVPMSVYVVTREELKRWGVRQLYELFQRVPGYSFYNTDYYGQYGPIGRGMQSIWRYGCSFELMNVVDFGHMTFAPNFFKSIEIARGPAGLMWGSGAEAGLLNFNVRDDLQGLEVGAQYGDYNRRAADIAYGGKFQKPGDTFFVGLHAEAQNAEEQNGAFDTPGQMWKMNGQNPAYCMLAKLKYEDFKFLFFQDHADHIAPKLWFGNDAYGGAPALQGAIEQFQPNVHDQLEVVSYRLEYHLPLKMEGFDFYFYHDYYKKQWWTESVALDTQRKRSIGFNSQTNLFQNKLTIDFGGTLWGEDQNTAPSFTSEWANTHYGINWYDDSRSPVSTSNNDLYLQAKYALLDNLKIILGGRVDYQRSASPETIYSGPRIALMYAPIEPLTLKYLYNSTRRRAQGNEAGQGVSYETLQAHDLIGMLKLNDLLTLDATLFLEELRDKITRSNDPNSLNAFVNTGGLQTYGLELALKAYPMKDLLVYVNESTFFSKVKITESGVPDAHNDSDEPLFVPGITAFAGGEYRLLSLVNLNLGVRYIGNVPYRTIEGTYTKASAVFLDFTARSVKFFDNHLELYLNALNLLDNRTRMPAFGEHAGNADGTLAPEGRRVMGGITFNW